MARDAAVAADPAGGDSGGRARRHAAVAAHAARLATLTWELGEVERRLAEVRSEVEALRSEAPTKSEVDAALHEFGGAWRTLSPRERAAAMRLVVKTVAFDGGAGKVRIEFHPSGLRTLPRSAAPAGTPEEAAQAEKPRAARRGKECTR